MGFFGGRKRKPIVGLDIGSSCVKAVELKRSREGYELISAGLEPLSPETVVDGAIIDALTVSSAIDRIYETQRIKNKNVGTTVSGHSVIIKKINMPMLEEDELWDQVYEDAGQYIPFDIADVSLDYQVLEPSFEGDSVEVLLVAVKRDKINNYQSALIGRNLALVDVDAFALQNTYEVNYDPDPDTTVALLNIGASVMNINIVRGGVPLFTRDVSVGGNQYTDALQKELDLSFEDAENFKRGQPLGEISEEQKTTVLRSVSEILVLEIQKTFDFFRATAGAEAISSIYCAGGAARTPGLLDMLREEFQMGVEEIDPFRNIRYNPDKFSDDYIREISPRLAVCVGLGLRSFDEA
ncbi:MAG: type IV pilus assembly protein PilM [Terriglobia bacterium]